MEYIAFLAVIILIVGVIMLTGIMEERKSKEMLREKLKKQYGQYSEKNMRTGEWKALCPQFNMEEMQRINL